MAMVSRRRFIKQVTAGAVLMSPVCSYHVFGQTDERSLSIGQGRLYSLSDGHLTLPTDFLFHDTIADDERHAVMARHGIEGPVYTPDCNISLWMSNDRIVLFDVGAGSQFPVGGGLLLESLAAMDIDPSAVTDVVFTHAHPDHLWGVVDDFDDLTFPEAAYHIPAGEWDYWMHASTLDKTPDSRKSFVVGAQNRLPRLSERMALFQPGDEVIPGIEAVATHGHTPGHCSFVIHSEGESAMIVGDALASVALSFEHPRWPHNSDQDPDTGVKTRLALLDRLTADKTPIVGFHMPAPGFGVVEKRGQAYQFVSA